MQKDRQMPGMVCVVVFLRFRNVNNLVKFTLEFSFVFRYNIFTGDSFRHLAVWLHRGAVSFRNPYFPF